MSSPGGAVPVPPWSRFRTPSAADGLVLKARFLGLLAVRDLPPALCDRRVRGPPFVAGPRSSRCRRCRSSSSSVCLRSNWAYRMARATWRPSAWLLDQIVLNAVTDRSIPVRSSSAPVRTQMGCTELPSSLTVARRPRCQVIPDPSKSTSNGAVRRRARASPQAGFHGHVEPVPLAWSRLASMSARRRTIFNQQDLYCGNAMVTPVPVSDPGRQGSTTGQPKLRWIGSLEETVEIDGLGCTVALQFIGAQHVLFGFRPSCKPPRRGSWKAHGRLSISVRTSRPALRGRFKGPTAHQIRAGPARISPPPKERHGCTAVFGRC